jgi:glycerol-3-phosphate dehydrogenase (NAD(P)+)
MPMSPQVTILGAGAMGSALATPLRASGWEVALWGTWLDDHLMDVIEAGAAHPRTGVVVAAGTRTFRSPDIAEALDAAQFVLLAVASVGCEQVMRRALPHLGTADALLLTSKGFATDADGRVQLLPDALRKQAAALGHDLPSVIAVGGPCKANEVAAGRWTAAVFGCRNLAAAQLTAKSIATPAYRAESTDGEAGVELCAAMKNVYAIALGLADGLGAAGAPSHDLKAAICTQTVRELVLLSDVVGGRPETAIGLAGVGDLEVTGLSGRNKIYGARIGAGEPAAAALVAMTAAELTVEGVPAARLARTLVDQRAPGDWDKLPLLQAILDVLDGAPRPAHLVAEAVLPRQ